MLSAWDSSDQAQMAGRELVIFISLNVEKQVLLWFNTFNSQVNSCLSDDSHPTRAYFPSLIKGYLRWLAQTRTCNIRWEEFFQQVSGLWLTSEDSLKKDAWYGYCVRWQSCLAAWTSKLQLFVSQLWKHCGWHMIDSWGSALVGQKTLTWSCSTVKVLN